jgi:hypothetical protein
MRITMENITTSVFWAMWGSFVLGMLFAWGIGEEHLLLGIGFFIGGSAVVALFQWWFRGKQDTSLNTANSTEAAGQNDGASTSQTP